MQAPASQDGETCEIISFHNCQGGLGVTLAEYQLSGASEDSSSTLILVKDIRPDGRAASDGRLRLGDKLVRINGQPIRNMALPAAAKTLADAIESGRATLAVSRDPALAAAFGHAAADGKMIPDELHADSDGKERDESLPVRHDTDSEDTVSESGSNNADEVVQTSGPLMPGFGYNQDRIGSFASLSPDVHAKGVSSLPDLSNDLIMGKPDDVPFCSTPNSLFTDGGASSKLWQNSTKSHNFCAHSAGVSSEAMYADASMIKLEKLESAMSFLGIHLTKAEQVEVQLLAEVDATGRVDFTRFVEKMRQLLRSRMSLLRRQNAASSPAAARSEISSSAMPQQLPLSSLSLPLRRPSPTAGCTAADLLSSPQVDVKQRVEPVASPIGYGTSGSNSSKLATSSKTKIRMRDASQQTDAADESAVIQQMQERIHELEDALRDRFQLCHTIELKAAKMRQKFLLADAQCKSLQTRLELAEAAQRAARRTEMDYEAVLLAVERALEDKERISEQAEHRTPATIIQGSPPAEKRIAILGCQLRKAEESRKVYEVATEQLLNFVRVVHEIADKSTGEDKGCTTAPARTVGIDAVQKARSCGLTSRESKDLAEKAMHIISATQSLLETQPLPFGWEEAYTADGKKYYLNHVTEETVWQHPVTKVSRRKL